MCFRSVLCCRKRNQKRTQMAQVCDTLQFVFVHPLFIRQLELLYNPGHELRDTCLLLHFVILLSHLVIPVTLLL